MRVFRHLKKGTFKKRKKQIRFPWHNIIRMSVFIMLFRVSRQDNSVCIVSVLTLLSVQFPLLWDTAFFGFILLMLSGMVTVYRKQSSHIICSIWHAQLEIFCPVSVSGQARKAQNGAKSGAKRTAFRRSCRKSFPCFCSGFCLSQSLCSDETPCGGAASVVSEKRRWDGKLIKPDCVVQNVCRPLFYSSS